MTKRTVLVPDPPTRSGVRSVIADRPLLSSRSPDRGPR